MILTMGACLWRYRVPSLAGPLFVLLLAAPTLAAGSQDPPQAERVRTASALLLSPPGPSVTQAAIVNAMVELLDVTVSLTRESQYGQGIKERIDIAKDLMQKTSMFNKKTRQYLSFSYRMTSGGTRWERPKDLDEFVTPEELQQKSRKYCATLSNGALAALERGQKGEAARLLLELVLAIITPASGAPYPELRFAMLAGVSSPARQAAARRSPAVTGQGQWGVLPLAPTADERTAPIEALKRQGLALAEAFTRHQYRNAKGEQMPYRLFTPLHLEAGRTYPLIVFLHGAGGSGTDNVKQLQGANMFGALAWTLPEHQKQHPAFVLAPQTDINWACTIFDPKNPPKTIADLKFCPPGVLGPAARLAFELIDDLRTRLPIDTARIYVTGHSMGGAGTWHMIAQRPRFFAAAVPVCGHPLPATAATVKDVPIWNFHGAADDVEPVATSRAMIEAIRRAGGHPRHTEYEGVGHNAFMWAYTEPALVEWLFAQKRAAGANPK